MTKTKTPRKQKSKPQRGWENNEYLKGVLDADFDRVQLEELGSFSRLDFDEEKW